MLNSRTGWLIFVRHCMKIAMEKFKLCPQGYPGHGSAAREYPGYGPGHQIAKMSDYGDHTPGTLNLCCTPNFCYFQQKSMEQILVPLWGAYSHAS